MASLEERLAGKRGVFVIAEAGVNHNGDFELARRLVATAAESGADAVKFQTFRADDVCSPDAEKAPYQKTSTAGDETQHSMLKKLELPREWHRPLRDEAKRHGLEFLSTAFDPDAVDFLAELGVPAFKVPSGEVTNPFLLERIAAHRKPVICSTGMCTEEDVKRVRRYFEERGFGPGRITLVLLHCVTAYPCPAEEANLLAIRSLASIFSGPVGYSDHTSGIDAAPIAVALGARVIEKHLTLDRSLPGPDHAASLEPDEFLTMARAIRRVEDFLGDGIKRPGDREMELLGVARRSLVIARDLPKGTPLTLGDLSALRPGNGLDPRRVEEFIGRRTRTPLAKGHRLAEDDVD